jgi:cytochrome bd-type quinol oxidase subunit 1
MGEDKIPITPESTVQAAVQAYLKNNGFSIEDYDRSVVMITFGIVTLPVPNPPQRQVAVRFHDLHHIVTGYQTDASGEAEISAWELRRGLRGFGLYVRAIIITGVFYGLIHSPRRTIRAWKMARSACALQPIEMARYQDLLHIKVSELRRLYDVPPRGLAA